MRLERLSPVHLQWRFQQLLEALDQRSDFDKLLDSIEVSTPSSPVEPHFAHEWESLLAHEAMTRHFNGDFADFSDVDNDDSCLSETASVTSDGSSTDTISTTTSCVLSAPLSIADDFDDILISSKLVRILSMPSQSSPELEEALIHLDKKQVLLCPTSLNAVSDAIPNLRHVLHPTCASNQGEIPQELFAVLLDTGCSVACTAFVEDFCGQLAYGHFGSVKTADGLAEIQGFGMVHWETVDVNGKTVLIKVPAYYVPTVDMRLLSPQDYSRYHRLQGEVTYHGNADTMYMSVKTSQDALDKDVTTVFAHMCLGSNLPFLSACTYIAPPTIDATKPFSVRPQVSTASAMISQSVYDERNVNLTKAQQALKLDHDRLGHVGFRRLQNLYRLERTRVEFDGATVVDPPCLVAQHKSMLSCAPPICATCQAARMRRRPHGAKHSQPDPEHTDVLRSSDLKPGDQISVDQYESSVRGRLPSTRGRERVTKKFVGGTLFYDHASSKIFVRHQSSLGAEQTINSLNSVIREAMESNVTLRKFHTDNGVFKAEAFAKALRQNYQLITKSGVGAHHQAGVAERAIGTVQAMARAMLLHVRIHWPDEFDAAMWPFALDYAVYIFNRMPANVKNGLSPDEVFSGMICGCDELRRMRVFGAPCFVLDPRLQDGRKIPKWEPRSRSGQFLGFSSEHSSTVGLIRNLRTGYITPQFHVVYDERFHTVTSEMEIDLEETWVDLFRDSRDLYITDHDPEVDPPIPPLDDSWLSDEPEQLSTEQKPSDSAEKVVIPPNDPISVDDEEDVPVENRPEDPPTQVGWFDVEVAPPRIDHDSGSESGSDDSSLEESERRKSVFNVRRLQSNNFYGINTVTNPENLIYATLDWENVSDDPMFQAFHDKFTRFLDQETCELLDPEGLHPFCLASKMQSEDYPSFREIMRMEPEERNKWMDSMDEELQVLFDSGAFEFVSREEAIRLGEEIVPTTWAFRKKRKPSGEVYRYKSRLCVRGDCQRDKDLFDTNATFAPVVEWSTVRMLFSLSLVEGWETASIDFKNAFAQATLPKPIYLELPPGYKAANPGSHDKVMKINKSLYGDRRAANLWYRMLRKSLIEEMGFHASEMDPCLFVKEGCVIITYVDDVIIFGRNGAEIDAVLQRFKDLKYDFSRDAGFSSYLGIQIDRQDDGKIKLTQPHLKASVVDVLGLADANPCTTPISTPLFKHKDSPLFDNHFNYRSALGMLQYLGNNTHPECAYAINACARYAIEPRQAHGNALQKIGRYLLGAMDDGLIIDPSGPMSLDLWVDADFAGNYTRSESDDPSSVRSRTGFVVTLGSVPVLWKSVVQSEIALSTMESEYISLSTGMRKLIQLRAVLFEIAEHFKLNLSNKLSTISHVWEDNRAARILATTDPPRMTPRSKSLAVKYHWFRSHLSDDSIVIKDIESAKQKADGFTKPLTTDLFRTWRHMVCGW